MALDRISMDLRPNISDALTQMGVNAVLASEYELAIQAYCAASAWIWLAMVGKAVEIMVMSSAERNTAMQRAKTIARRRAADMGFDEELPPSVSIGMVSFVAVMLAMVCFSVADAFSGFSQVVDGADGDMGIRNERNKLWRWRLLSRRKNSSKKTVGHHGKVFPPHLKNKEIPYQSKRNIDHLH